MEIAQPECMFKFWFCTIPKPEKPKALQCVTCCEQGREETISVHKVVVKSLNPSQDVVDTCFSLNINFVPDPSSLHDPERETMKNVYNSIGNCFCIHV